MINRKWFFINIAIAATLIAAYCYYDRQFRESAIQGEWPYVASEAITKEDLTFLQNAFSQPFYYLDRGKQSFVFVSQDRSTVLKFFDNRCLRSGPLSFFFNISEKRCEKKLQQAFEGYHVANMFDRINTGLLFVQLAPNPAYDFEIIVIDRFGIHHKVNLAEVPFVLQQKAIPLRELISALLNKGDVEQAKRRFRQMAEMYLQEYSQGVFDRDHNFMYNTGFVGEKPIRIDLGRLQVYEGIKDPALYRQDLQKVFIKRLGGWLDRYFPQYRQEILDEMKKEMNF